MAKQERQYKPSEIAELLNVTPRAIQKWCEAGRFPGAFKTGDYPTSRWRIPQSGYDAYMKKQRAQAVVA